MLNVAGLIAFVVTHRAAVAAVAYLVYVIAAGNTAALVPAVVGVITALGLSSQITFADPGRVVRMRSRVFDRLTGS